MGTTEGLEAGNDMSSFSLWGSDASGRVGRMDGGWRQVAGSPDESYHNSPSEAERGGTGDRGEGMDLEGSGPLSLEAAGAILSDGALFSFLASVPLLHDVPSRVVPPTCHFLYLMTQSVFESTAYLHLSPAACGLSGCEAPTGQVRVEGSRGRAAPQLSCFQEVGGL